VSVSVAVAVLAAALSLLVAGLARRYAITHALIDKPNARSSHSTDTPRGGGIGIVVAVLSGTGLLLANDLIDPGLGKALLFGGGAVAAIGWIDDHRHIGARWRALVHLLAAAWALLQLGGLPSLSVAGWTLELGLFGVPLALLGMVWVTNLYNFMDGIDGIAGSEGLFVAASAALLLALQGHHGMALLCLLIAAACSGFLYWNWPPTRLFMGDVGSGFLGYCFAVLALTGENSGELPIGVWLLLLAPFIADASYTLLARLLRGERVYEAHRQHAYQRLVRRPLSHLRVTLGWSALNLALILPLSLAVFYRPSLTLPVIALLYAALWLAWRRAG